jgi:hypothetical protein
MFKSALRLEALRVLIVALRHVLVVLGDPLNSIIRW